MDKQKRKLKPYAVGFNGHAACCDCGSCLPKRETAFKKWLKSQPQLHGYPLPEGNQTVFVGAYWRRPPNFRRQLLRRVA